MIWGPKPLGNKVIEKKELKADKKLCKRIGNCGIGDKALYLSNLYFDCCYYIPVDSVFRVFKRVAMSKGGFTGKGSFASISYLVVVYDNGVEKQCFFKHEEQVDQFLCEIEKHFPNIKLISNAAELRLAKKAKQESEKPIAKLDEESQHAIERLEVAK